MTKAATTAKESRTATKADKREEAKKRADWAEVAAGRGARRALRSYLLKCFVYTPCPADSMHAQGIRDAALTFMNTLRVNCPEALLLMETEAAEDRLGDDDASEPAEDA